MKVETNIGDKVEIRNVMIETEFNTLEEGIDVFIDGKYAFNMIGYSVDTITIEELSDEVNDFKYSN